MKTRVKILQSIAGTGDPSMRDLERKYQRAADVLREHSKAARAMGKRGHTDEEITAIIAEQRKRDGAIPRVSGFTMPFDFRPGDETSIDAELAEKWEACGICTILEKKAAVA